MTRLHVRSKISFAGVNSATKLVGTDELGAVVVGGHVGLQQFLPLGLIITFHAVVLSIVLPLT